MEINKEKEVLLKDNIFDIYIKCKLETSSDRRQAYIGQLAEKIYKWCRDYLSYKVYDKRTGQSEIMGAEIFNIAIRLFKENSKAKVPEDKSGFFGYIINSLKNAENEYRKNFMSKNEYNITRMQESYLGRKLTEDEKENVITIWFDHEIAENPNVDYLINSNTAIICKAVKSVLEKKQDRSRDCYRALFTLHCIENKHTEGLFSILDQDIINVFQKDDIKPKQYEIWQKYHPDTKKTSSEVQASKNLNDFLWDLETYLKEKNPEIFH